jgi:hypothetical protein
MLAGTENGISKANIVKGAAKDLDFHLEINRERLRAGPRKGFNIVGMIETIYFEPDRDCRMPLEKAAKVGRRIYWPENGPLLAVSIPETDLLIPSRLPLRRGRAWLPDVPNPERPAENPYEVDQHGQSHLAPDEKEHEAPKQEQLLEEIASSKFRNFLVFHPISQIIVIPTDRKATWAALGSAKMPISSYSSFDGTKMALLVDPYTGEMFLKGGRASISEHFDPNAVRGETTAQRADREEIQTLLGAAQ